MSAWDSRKWFDDTAVMNVTALTLMPAPSAAVSRAPTSLTRLRGLKTLSKLSSLEIGGRGDVHVVSRQTVSGDSENMLGLEQQ